MAFSFRDMVTGTSNPSNEFFGGLLGLAGDAAGLYSAGRTSRTADRIAAESNPFAKYRPLYGEKLAALMKDPSAVEDDPSYQFARDQGLETINRQTNAKGFSGSGFEAGELMKYASGFASQYVGAEKDRLANLAGAGINPTPLSGAVGAQESAYDQGSNVLRDVGQLFGRGSKIPGAEGLLGAASGIGGGAAAGGAQSAASYLATFYPEAVPAATGAGGGLGATIASGAESLGSAVSAGFNSAYTALASMGPVGWIGAAALAAGVAIAAGQPSSSPLNKFDINTMKWSKGENFADSKYSPEVLNAYYGPALQVFSETGDAAKALAALPPPTNEEEAKLAKGAKHLFSGTDNPFRQIAKAKGFGKGIWTAGYKGKKDAIKSLSETAAG